MRSTRVLGAAVLVAALFVGAATSVAAEEPEAPSSGWNDWSCRPAAEHPNPVVLLHGLGGEQSNWDYVAPALVGEGYCVFSLTYGRAAPACSGGGTGPIAASAEEIAAFMDEVRAATGAPKVDLVGHSEGGFHTLYIPKVLARADEVGRVVAIGTHEGGRSPLLETVDLLGARPVLAGLSRQAGCEGYTDILPGSAVRNELADGPIAQPGVEYTVVNSRLDVFVVLFNLGFDPPIAQEAGVRHIWVQDICPLDPVGHISLISDPSVLSMVKNALDPANAGPVTCGFGLPI